MRCAGCSTLIPHYARHCPKCGKPVPKGVFITEPLVAPDAIPARGPLPRSGKALVASIVLGLILGSMGLWWQWWILCWIGAGLVALIIVLLVIADHLGI